MVIRADERWHLRAESPIEWPPICSQCIGHEYTKTRNLIRVSSWLRDFVTPAMYQDLTDFLADLDKRKLLARINEPVSPDLEIAAVTDRVSKTAGGGPGLLV